MTEDVVIDGLPYPVVIAADASKTLPPLIAGECRSAVVVFDKRVASRARAISAAFAKRSIATIGTIPLAAGEAAKRASVVSSLYRALLEASAERSTWLIAIGGGTITDVAGFAAATFLRGIRWAAVPTTVLGMADAAIGGKTGIDLPQGKNLVGAFWDPSAVVADLAAMRTLPARERATGFAEAVKCAIIDGTNMLDRVSTLSPHSDISHWKDAIVSAASVKAAIVAGDPRESGRRAVLNLGHTVGHAIEVASAYRVPHGEAVAIGIRAAGIIARAKGGWPVSDHARVLDVLRGAGLPVYVRGLKLDPILKAVSRDKKAVDGRVRFVLPMAIGDVRHGIEVDQTSVRTAVEACLSPPRGAELTG